MTALLKQDWWISPEEYLEGETVAAARHEYVGGVVYAMAGAKNVHNVIVVNLLGELFAQLRGQRCRPFNSDTKVRIQYPDHTRFYYPDAMVVCDPNPLDEVFQDRPVAIFEVASESTSRTDRDEKLRAYQTIPSLQAYVLLESHRMTATIHRRTEQGWEGELLTGPGSTIELPGIGCALPLRDLYTDSGL